MRCDDNDSYDDHPSVLARPGSPTVPSADGEPDEGTGTRASGRAPLALLIPWPRRSPEDRLDG